LKNQCAGGSKRGYYGSSWNRGIGGKAGYIELGDLLNKSPGGIGGKKESRIGVKELFGGKVERWDVHARIALRSAE